MVISSISTMTSRERMRCVLRRQEPDRLPRVYYGNGRIDAGLRAHFALGPEGDLGRALACDLRGLGLPYRGPVLFAPDSRPGHRRDPQSGVINRWIEHGSGGYWEAVDFPLREADVDAVRAWPMPEVDDYDFAVLDGQVAQAGDLALAFGNAGFGDVMNSSTLLFGMEEMLVRLAEDDEALALFIERRNVLQQAMLARVLERVGERLDVVHIGEDLGSQRGPLISPALFERQVAPRLQALIELARRHEVPVLMHSCGASHHFFDRLAAMGVACMETLQPEAEGMQPARLKRDFGDRLAFMGGLSTAGVLAHGSPEAVRAEVRAICDAFMPGGGYCFAPTHQVQDDTPVANVLAAYDEALHFGVYA